MEDVGIYISGLNILFFLVFVGLIAIYLVSKEVGR